MTARVCPPAAPPTAGDHDIPDRDIPDMNESAPPAGLMQRLEPGLRSILCPNPSPMTYWGTNTFVLGEGAVAVVDPGPDMTPHMQAVLDGLEPGEHVAQILVSHAHSDHAALARRMHETTGAPILAYGRAEAGRSDVMRRLVAAGMTPGGESAETGFAPDETLADGERFMAGGLEVEALWTPGHYSSHLAFAVGDAVLVGDHVMAWASSLVSPPDGDLTAFMATCEKLRVRGDRIHYPSHGPAITDTRGRLDWLIAHRKGRERNILDGLKAGPQTIAALTRAIYTETPPPLIPAAERNVFAHLIDLETRGRVTATPSLGPEARFALAGG